MSGLRQDLLLLGAGGHAREVGLAARRAGWRVLGAVADGEVDRPALQQAGIDFLGPLSEMSRVKAVFCAAVGDPAVRRTMAQRAVAAGLAAAGPVVDPDASVRGADLAAGVVLLAGARVTAGAAVAEHVHVNLNATVAHDCVVDEFATLSPGVHLNGRVVVGRAALLGAGAVVLPGIRIGAGCVVGAGSVVTGDVASGETVLGVPARGRT